MSAYPPHDRSTPADRWPTTAAINGLSAVPVAHAIDLASIFTSPLTDRSEALAAETRRHLAGCLRSVETSLRLSASMDPALSQAIGQLRDPLCWPTVCARPSLIGPGLLGHMRMRAGISLILRQRGRGDEDAAVEGIAIDLLDPADARLSESAALLAMAEGRWATRGNEDQPMRADLPAERFAELVWTAVGILAQALAPAWPSGERSAIALLTQAGRGLLARHDEAAGPLAAADRVVSRLGEAADEPGRSANAIAQRRILLFAALAARRLRMATEAVVDILLTEPVAHLAALCIATGASGAEFRHLLLTLQAARPSLSDAVILGAADHYVELDIAQVEDVVAILTAPPLLRVTLDHLRAGPAA